MVVVCVVWWLHGCPHLSCISGQWASLWDLHAYTLLVSARIRYIARVVAIRVCILHGEIEAEAKDRGPQQTSTMEDHYTAKFGRGGCVNTLLGCPHIQQ